MWSTPSLSLLLGPYRVLVPVGVPSMGQIDLFKNYSYSIGSFPKKLLRRNNTKNVNMSVQWRQLSNL